jgi:predicted phage terminase large subunit-like protein
MTKGIQDSKYDVLAATLPLDERRKLADELRGKDRERFLCKWDLRYLCFDVLGYKDWDLCHDDMYEFFEKHKDEKRLLLLIPRGHLKSSVVTIGMNIQDMLRNPNIRILVANAIWDNARSFVGQIGDYCSKYGNLKELFGEFRPKSRGNKGWNKDAITIQQRTMPLKEATITSTGVGRTQASQHYDKIVLDDVVSRENIGTKEQRSKIVDFYGDCLSLLEPDGKVVVVGTTWHEDDLYNLLKKDTGYKTYLRKALDPANFTTGEPIFPKKFSKQTLMDIKGEFEKKGKLGQFYAQYFLDPYPDEDAEFQKEHVKYYSGTPIGELHVSVCLDPSLGKSTSDNAGISATGVDKDGKVYILDARNFKVHIDRIGYEIVKTLDKLKGMSLNCQIIAIEGFGFQQVLETPIRKILTDANYGHVPLEILPRSTEESKDSRIMALIPYFAEGRIWMTQNMVDLKDEMIRFKKNVKRRKDDILDSLAWQIQYWSRKPVERLKEKCPEGSFGQMYQNRLGFIEQKTLKEEFGIR